MALLEEPIQSDLDFGKALFGRHVSAAVGVVSRAVNAVFEMGREHEDSELIEGRA
jgi:hypothetical protein